jgi:hypothetical protein
MNVLTSSLPRRTVLRGLGATLALPFLDAMAPAFSLRGRAAAKPPSRFQAFYVPNGMAMQYWSPKGEGRTFELSPILEPLAPFRDQMLVLSGIKANWNYIHAGASGSFLTGTTRGGRTEIEIIADVSIDQLLARHFASETQLASLELSMDVPANAGRVHRQSELRLHAHAVVARPDAAPADGMESAGPCSSGSSVTAAAPTEGAREATAAGSTRAFSTRYREAGQPQEELGTRIRPRIDEYRRRSRRRARIRRPSSRRTSSCRQLAAALRCASGVRRSPGFDADLQLLALRSDLTRVVSFMLGRNRAHGRIRRLACPKRNHPLSHHNDVPELIAHMSKINRYHTQLFRSIWRSCAPRPTATARCWIT